MASVLLILQSESNNKGNDIGAGQPAMIYCSEYHNYHFFSALNIFNDVCRTEIYSGLVSFESEGIIDTFYTNQINRFPQARSRNACILL